ncbi:response regulator transcription factor [Butyrivibrio sp. WCD3002]|uniref:response regulator transcription factor n=1 Tax=Butyrivibrio sp. WCD3002 TaxID=1280676 RepID=UPI00040EC4D6|nr:helix-turn-helix domain-containing protein [Butyrivibrio sp. WCD3002]
MTLLIVDDEFYLVQGVKNAIDFEALGIDEIYTAYSADQARSVYEEHTVDILLSDVEMPRENGLSLIKWVKDNGYESINILLTGHANFNYAREGISLQILDYVLKPVEENSLREVMERAIDKVKENQQQKSEHLQTAKQELWRNLYNGTISADQDTITEFMTKNSIPEEMAEIFYYYAYLRAETTDDVFSANAVLSALEDQFSSGIYVTAVDKNRFMINISLSEYADVDSELEKKLYTCFTNTMDKLQKENDSFRFVFYLFSGAPLSAAPYAYELLEHYSKNILTSENKVISIANVPMDSISAKTASDSEQIDIAKWEELLSMNRADDILLDIRGLLMKTDSTFSAGLLRSIYYGLMSAVFTVLVQKNCSPMNISSQMTHATDPRTITTSSEGLLQWANSLLRSASDLLTSQNPEENIVEQVKLFIKDHIDDTDLSRTTIAEAVHISPDYLSYVFHKESGEVLSSYINGERIAIAKKLLLNTAASSQEIADKTGFSNVSYFSKQFKKTTGLTPNAYRSEHKK